MIIDFAAIRAEIKARHQAALEADLLKVDHVETAALELKAGGPTVPKWEPPNPAAVFINGALPKPLTPLKKQKPAPKNFVAKIKEANATAKQGRVAASYDQFRAGIKTTEVQP